VSDGLVGKVISQEFTTIMGRQNRNRG